MLQFLIKIFLFILIITRSPFLLGQDTIYLKNPSFEGIPTRGQLNNWNLPDWEDCSPYYFPDESPPDVHPVPTGGWGVISKAFDGQTYLGMVVRETGTWEMVSQKLNKNLMPGQCYIFHAYLSISDAYKSRTKLSPDALQDFSPAVIFRIWGGNEDCERLELLAKSPPVGVPGWKEYHFLFKPTREIKTITLEAFYHLRKDEYKDVKEWAYNGHILVDNLSPIIEFPCRKE
jgi:hypothetical protein